MSKIALSGDASGTGTFTIASPNSNSNYTLTLPAESGTVLTTGSTTGISASALSTGTIPKARMYAGAVLQVVSGYNSGRVQVNTTSYSSMATSPSITPSSATSKILVFMQTSIFRSGANGNAYFAIYRNGVTSLIGAGSVENAGWWNDYSAYTFGQWTFAYLDSPATTSATNYQVMGKADSTSTNAGISGRGLDTDHQNGVTWTLMEIAA